MITLKNVYKRFPLHAGLFAAYGKYIYAINGVSIHVKQNETYGLVGESGSGKTTLAKIIAGIHTFDHGQLIIDNTEYRIPFSRPQSIQYIFQDPAKSLNPRQNIYHILTDGYRNHLPPQERSKERLIEAALEQLHLVGLDENALYRRPTEFSGGQRQRIAIARCLIHRPQILICDEIVSALDVSIQAQIINLLSRLRSQFSMTMLFIAHDLSLVSYFCDRVGVLYRGTLVEEATSMRLLKEHRHPYTRHLFRSTPSAAMHTRSSASTPAATAPAHRAADSAHSDSSADSAHPDRNADLVHSARSAGAVAGASPTTRPASWEAPTKPRVMKRVAPDHIVLDEAL